MVYNRQRKSVNKYVRQNLSKYPVKEWSKTQISKSHTTESFACLQNSTRYIFEDAAFTATDLTTESAKFQKLYRSGAGTWGQDDYDAWTENLAHHLKMNVKFTQNSFIKYLIRNNDLHSGYLRIYEYDCLEHQDTARPIEYWYQRGINEYYRSNIDIPYRDETLVGGKPTNSEYMFEYPTAWENTFTETWSRKRPVKTIYMPPGSEFTYTMKPASYKMYEAEELSNLNQAYIPSTKMIVFRVTGTLSHDSDNANEIGLCAVQFDVLKTQHLQVAINEVDTLIYKQDLPTEETEVMTAPVQAHQNVELEAA